MTLDEAMEKEVLPPVANAIQDIIDSAGTSDASWAVLKSAGETVSELRERVGELQQKIGEMRAMMRAMRKVEKLSFAEHDPTPVTKDWLISIGFHEGDHFIFGINNGDYENAINGHFWSNPPVHFVLRAGDMDVTEYATRGQVRSLCRVLGIVINERN